MKLPELKNKLNKLTDRLPEEIYTPTKKWKGKSDSVKARNLLWNTCRALVFLTYSKDGKVICYTCGAIGLIKQNRQLGHFIVGADCPVSLFFEVLHLRPQCYKCNIWLSGRSHVFREKLVAEIGEDEVKNLENRRTLESGNHWSIIDYEKMIESILLLLEETMREKGIII